MVTECEAPITKAELKEWLRRLRSGKYRQRGGQLTDVIEGKRGYCCLGVLAALRVKPSKLSGGYLTKASLGITGSVDDTLAYMLPELVQCELIDLNDNKTMPFELIADIIEHHPEIQP